MGFLAKLFSHVPDSAVVSFLILAILFSQLCAPLPPWPKPEPRTPEPDPKRAKVSASTANYHPAAVLARKAGQGRRECHEQSSWKIAKGLLPKR